MKQENQEIFLLQADRILTEVFNQFSENFFEKIEIKQFENQFPQEQSEMQLQASAFFTIIARDQLLSELDDKKSVFISNAFTENGLIYFLVIHYNPSKDKLVQKYQTYFNYLKDTLFTFLIDEWKKDNFYFYNSSINDILIHNSINDFMTEISKKCCGYEEIALYENINLSMLNILTDLSYLTYEKINTEGLIHFTNSPLNADFQFRFDNPEDFGFFNQSNLKLLRKLLELTSIRKDIGIITDTNLIYGIGKIKPECLYYSATFEDDHKWTISKNDIELISIKDNSIQLENSRITPSEFNNYVSEIFPEISEENYSNMYNIIKTLIKQQKGTILVVMKDAQKYIDRYRDLAILIDPVKLDEKNVEKLSSIDGAIIMDENCICYGFGVVLDGIDTGSGNRARGSRYNSSERFYNYCKSENNSDLFVFILSDDGNYNFFPN